MQEYRVAWTTVVTLLRSDVCTRMHSAEEFGFDRLEVQ
jgi:hypothetical protein